jgi:S1-C subfamily serine protease
VTGDHKEIMPLRIRKLVSAVVFAAFMLATAASKAQRGLGDQDASLPDTLKSLDYVKLDVDKSDNILGYAELRDIMMASQAYARGVSMLPGYHEPIVTRGETGMSVFRKVSPSVVLVVTGSVKDGKLTDVGIGTGVVIDPSGYVLTNWHVIAGYETGVIFLKPKIGTEPQDNDAYVFRVVAQDEKTDLALLRIVKPPAGLPAVRFGDVSNIQVAEDIHIIGHPHGKLWSYSTGVISQIRDNYDWKYSDGSEHLANVLQMQTAVNPGNSGGPVLDNNSNLLGLVAMSEEGQNLNYAVAIDVISKFVARSMALKSRGVGPSGQGEKGDVYAARTKAGLFVTKRVYAELVSYELRNAKGVPVTLVAETPDGAALTGSEPNAFGGFGLWSMRLPDGRVVVARSGGIAPELVSAGR